jgi:hypothetical protein
LDQVTDNAYDSGDATDIEITGTALTAEDTNSVESYMRTLRNHRSKTHQLLGRLTTQANQALGEACLAEMTLVRELQEWDALVSQICDVAGDEFYLFLEELLSNGGALSESESESNEDDTSDDWRGGSGGGGKGDDSDDNHDDQPPGRWNSSNDNCKDLVVTP